MRPAGLVFVQLELSLEIELHGYKNLENESLDLYHCFYVFFSFNACKNMALFLGGRYAPGAASPNSKTLADVPHVVQTA